jgi:hypothetical protein
MGFVKVHLHNQSGWVGYHNANIKLSNNVLINLFDFFPDKFSTRETDP